MNSKVGKTLVLAVLSAIAVAGTANAAPNRSTPLGPDKTSFAWTTDTQTAAITGQFWWLGNPDGDCGTFDFGAGGTPPVDACDLTLVDVTEAGVLSASLPAGDENTNDWDLYLYSSDDDGHATDTEQIASSEEIGGAEEVSAAVEPGKYLVVAVPYQVVNDATDASVKWTEPAPEASDE